jgi:cystathionine beta-lyase/cystathionine gamma-synthase
MIDALRVARSATSLGGPETLVCHPGTSTHVALAPDEQIAIGITPGLVRISIGLEDGDDIAADLERAIRPDGRPARRARRNAQLK